MTLTTKQREQLYDRCRVCSVCGVEKPLGEFPMRGDRPRLDCKACARERSLKWKREHPGEDTRRGRKWRQENPERFKTRVAKYRAANRQRFRESSAAWEKKNPDKRREVAKRYRKKNPDKWHTYTQRNRARKNKVIVLEMFSVSEIFARDGWRCQICGDRVERSGGPFSPLYPTIDHILALAKGGQHTRENVQTAHRICNLKKHTKPNRRMARS